MKVERDIYSSYRINGEKTYHLDTGNDSTVERVGQTVYKLYDMGPFGVEQIRAYQMVTNQAREFIGQNPQVGNITINGTPYTYDFVIHPIIEVAEVVVEAPHGREETHHITISEYVSGPQLRHFEYQFAESPTQRNKKVFDDLSILLNEALNVKGIKIDSGNVKMRVNLKAKHITFIVTDLCEELRSLEVEISTPALAVDPHIT